VSGDRPPASLAELTGALLCRYPLDYVSEERCETALVLFGAGFYGLNDGAWLAGAGLLATVVDVDRLRLDVMQRIYPAAWTFECSDAYEYVEGAAASSRRWDLLSIDPPVALCGGVDVMLPALVKLANSLVVVTRLAGSETVSPPPGWHVVCRRSRSSAADWVVLKRSTHPPAQ